MAAYPTTLPKPPLPGAGSNTMTAMTDEQVSRLIREAMREIAWAQSEALISLIEALAFAMQHAGADMDIFRRILRLGLNGMPDDDVRYDVIRAFYQRVLEDISQEAPPRVVPGGKE